MARTGGEKTRRKILDVAEKLFAEKGFDAASVEEIAKTAGVNKALIYYHFKDKNDLITCLFKSVIEDLNELVTPGADTGFDQKMIKKDLGKEVSFLTERKDTLSLVLAEAFRSGKHSSFLFRCAELAFTHGHGHAASALKEKKSRADQRLLIQEFFFGFLPVITFATLKDRWCDFFGCNAATVQKDFVEAFAKSHLESHKKE